MKKYKKVYIEITNICNLKCEFCPEITRDKRVMQPKEFEFIADAVKPYTDFVYFHLMGEPLLNKHLAAFLDICYNRQLRVNITTNGTLINTVQDILLNSPALRKVSFSLHSYEVNDSIMSLKQYIENISNFITEALKNTNIICELRLWNEDSEAIKGANNLNDEIIRIIEERLGLDFEKPEGSSGGIIRLCKNLYISKSKRFEWPDIDGTPKSKEVFCYGLRDQFGILADGTVVPCCLDSNGVIDLGNIFTTPLDKILESPRAKALYEGFSRRNPSEEICRTCGFAGRFSVK